MKETTANNVPNPPGTGALFGPKRPDHHTIAMRNNATAAMNGRVSARLSPVSIEDPFPSGG